jgi:predicted branched-subunit amino acid permease
MTSSAPDTSETDGRDRSSAGAGSRDTVPVLLGVLPVALAIGVTAHRAGVDPLAAWSASFLFCAGTAQLTAIELLGAGAAPFTIVLTVALINSRFVLYSAGLARWFEGEPMWRRLLLAFPLVDQLFVVCERRFSTEGGSVRARRWYYVGAAVTLVGGWSATQAVAVGLGSSVPNLGVLQYTAPLVFVALLTGAVRDRAGAVAAVVGAVVAVTTIPVPFHLNLAAGIAAGLVAGRVADGRRSPVVTS